MKKPKLTTMYHGKEVEYEECPPTPEAVALIMRAVAEHKDSVMEGLIADLWERHQEEIMGNHGGDRTCSYCNTMREACRLLKIAEPRLAAHCMAPSADLYREADL